MKGYISWFKRNRWMIMIALWLVVFIQLLLAKDYVSATFALLLIVSYILISIYSYEIKQQDKEIEYWQDLVEKYSKENKRIYNALNEVSKEEA